ncbi:hypothetical protein F4774DRAFT_409529 [Daldinia eschscholtzii]|nr:hypothetical protein F4774DRAFT_409529 [Daldinia eschscholtzii]
MPSRLVTEQQRELDFLLISELFERVTEFRREGKTARAQQELHRRRLRNYYADLKEEAAKERDNGESSRQTDAITPKTPRRCEYCKDLKISNQCLKNGGCAVDNGKRPA